MDRSLLIIDDSPFVAVQVGELVKDKGYHIIGSAKNGMEGIVMYQELKPDFIVLDIIMPGIDGIETAKRILALDPKAKIVMLSSLFDPETLEEVKSAGVKFLIPKPVEKDILLVTLEMIDKTKSNT